MLVRDVEAKAKALGEAYSREAGEGRTIVGVVYSLLSWNVDAPAVALCGGVSSLPSLLTHPGLPCNLFVTQTTPTSHPLGWRPIIAVVKSSQPEPEP